MPESWRRHLEFEPDEARMLGLAVEGRKSLRRLDEQIAWYSELAPEAGPALRRLAALAVRRFDRGDEHATLERMLLPRMIEMPDAEGFIDEHATLLLEGLSRAAVAPVEIVEHFCAHELPVITREITDPSSAWHRLYGVVRDQLLLAAQALGPDRWILGEDEYAWRLANMGLGDSPETIAANARACLREQQAAILDLLEHPRGSSFAEALPQLRAIVSERLGPGEVVPSVRAANRRCVAFVREHGLFELPDDFEVPISEVPPELATMTHAGNLPAPLFGEGGGSFMVLDVPARHRRAWLEPLAVHEGVPGHYLQSWLWQRHFRTRRAAPSFVSFADPFAAERQDWGAMLAIEGWAVYAEDLMLQAGFHAREQALAVASFHAIRCARACIDIGLHTRTMTRADALALLLDEVGLDPAEAEREVMRSVRIPTQPLTYFAGWQAIAGLVRASGLPLAEAHRRLLEFGPTLPARL